jgi:hypothetical protein
MRTGITPPRHAASHISACTAHGTNHAQTRLLNQGAAHLTGSGVLRFQSQQGVHYTPHPLWAVHYVLCQPRQVW